MISQDIWRSFFLNLLLKHLKENNVNIIQGHFTIKNHAGLLFIVCLALIFGILIVSNRLMTCTEYKCITSLFCHVYLSKIVSILLQSWFTLIGLDYSFSSLFFWGGEYRLYVRIYLYQIIYLIEAIIFPKCFKNSSVNYGMRAVTY